MGRAGSKSIAGRSKSVGKHPEVGKRWQSQGTEAAGGWGTLRAMRGGRALDAAGGARSRAVGAGSWVCFFLKILFIKPGGEGQIPYDLTFNWNIINKRKKQTKYNQRH